MAVNTLEIIQKGSSTYGHFKGFLYCGSDTKGDDKYWKCRHRPGCAAHLTTVNTDRNFIIRRGGSAADHKTHGPDPKEVEALRIQGNINVMLSPPFFYYYLTSTLKLNCKHAYSDKVKNILGAHLLPYCKKHTMLMKLFKLAYRISKICAEVYNVSA